TVGKRAGLSLAVHLGERVDFDLNMMLGAGHPGAISLGAGLVLRWDALVHDLERNARADAYAEEDCPAIAARYHRQCRLRPAPATRPSGSRSAPDARRRSRGRSN